MKAIHRLRHNDDFRTVTRHGVRAAKSHVVAHLLILEDENLKRIQAEPRVGFVVSKKVGNSVVRSRVKRRMSAIMRQHLSELPAYSCLVLRSQPGINELSHEQLVHELLAVTEQALKKLAAKGQRP